MTDILTNASPQLDYSTSVSSALGATIAVITLTLLSSIGYLSYRAYYLNMGEVISDEKTVKSGNVEQHSDVEEVRDHPQQTTNE